MLPESQPQTGLISTRPQRDDHLVAGHATCIEKIALAILQPGSEDLGCTLEGLELMRK